MATPQPPPRPTRRSNLRIELTVVTEGLSPAEHSRAVGYHARNLSELLPPPGTFVSAVVTDMDTNKVLQFFGQGNGLGPPSDIEELLNALKSA